MAFGHPPILLPLFVFLSPLIFSLPSAESFTYEPLCNNNKKMMKKAIFYNKNPTYSKYKHKGTLFLTSAMLLVKPLNPTLCEVLLYT